MKTTSGTTSPDTGDAAPKASFSWFRRSGLTPVERAFFDEQHKHTIGTVRLCMSLGLMLWIVQAAIEYGNGIASPTRSDLMVRLLTAVLLAGIALLYRPTLSSVRGHILLASFGTMFGLGLLGLLYLVPERWPYTVASLSILILVSVALWIRMSWIGLGLGPTIALIAFACIRGFFPQPVIPLACFYMSVAAMFGVVLRSGRIRPAFEVFILRQQLTKKALLDPLTKVWNRAGWEARLESEVPSESGSARACVLFIDLDHFKSINDRYGHDRGDMVLRQVAESISNTLRGRDILARMGGEEFSVWLAGVNEDKAVMVAERIRRRVAALKLLDSPISVSIGLSCVQMGEDVAQAVRRADEALFQAKEDGRNRVWVWGRQSAEQISS